LITFVRNGVRAELLREGRGETLFIVPGLGGEVAELSALTAAFTGPQEVYALIPLLHDAEGQPIITVDRMAELMVPVVRELSSPGACRLAGYSFGGLIALELGRRLRHAGQPVDGLFLIEAIYDQNFWPRKLWLTAAARRTRRHLGRIARLPPRSAAAELRMRCERLMRTVARRGGANDYSLPETAWTAMAARAYLAMAAYRPPHYDGPLTLITTLGDQDFGCTSADLWAGYARRATVQRVAGDHVSIMTEPNAVAAVARVIDHGLEMDRANWSGMRPAPGFERPMFVTTVRWFSAARLAHALSEAGFTVSTCRPKGHPLDLVDSLATVARFRRLWPLRSIAQAIRAANPDLVICDDEPSLALLRRLHARVRTSDPEMARLLARSLGKVEDWPSLTSRAGLAAEAHALEVATPITCGVGGVAEVLNTWVAGRGLPIVLKTDGSWGGRGVAIVRDVEYLPRAWRRIAARPGLIRALKRAVSDRELNTMTAWVRRQRPVVNAQQFCAGQEAIVTVASVDGEVRAMVCLEVVQTSEPRGPAVAVRIIDHPQMAETARKLIRRFGLTGFSGFDFLIDNSGVAQLLEMNSRVTPTAHLLVEGHWTPGHTVGLFPFELLRDKAVGAEMFDVVDVPVRAPLLVEQGTAHAARRHHPTRRTMRRVIRKINGNDESAPAPAAVNVATGDVPPERKSHLGC
jgi:thioesterase domain-containing protein